MNNEQPQMPSPKPPQVFISWSGPRSQKVAATLRKWLPRFLRHNVTPWMSSVDIASGTRWSEVIAEHLSESDLGIVCVTPYNLKAPWIHFEAGAVAKRVADSRIFPLMIDVGTSKLSGPLGQYQAIVANKEGIRDLVRSIDGLLRDRQLGFGDERERDSIFDALWLAWQSEFEAAVNSEDPEQEDETSTQVLSSREDAFDYLCKDYYDFANRLSRNPEPVYIHEARRMGVGHGSATFECEIDEVGFAQVTREIEVEAFSEVGSLDTFLIFPEGSKFDNTVDTPGFSLKSVDSLQKGRSIKYDLKPSEKAIQVCELSFSPSLLERQQTKYKMVEASGMKCFDLTKEEYFGWAVSRPTRKLMLSVTLPTGMKPEEVKVEVKRSRQSGFPDAPLVKSEIERLTNPKQRTLPSRQVELSLEIPYPMIGLQYMIRWRSTLTSDTVES